MLDMIGVKTETEIADEELAGMQQGMETKDQLTNLRMTKARQHQQPTLYVDFMKEGV